MNEQNDNNYYVDEKGYNELENKIASLKEKLNNLYAQQKQSMETVKDAWHSTDLSDIAERKALIEQEIYDYTTKLKNAIIVSSEKEKDIVDLNDIVVLNVTFKGDNVYFDDGEEEMIVKLVGTDGNFDKDITEVSINSPLGSSIYKKHIGEKTSYKINNNNKAEVYIKEKITKKKLVRQK